MGKRTILIDDFTEQELPSETKPLRLSIGNQAYDLFLSEDSTRKLLEVLQPFTENAERVATAAGGSSRTDRRDGAAVRAWAIETGFKFKNAAGEEKTVSERGRIPKEAFDAYDQSN